MKSTTVMSMRLYKFLVLLVVIVPLLCTFLAIYLAWNRYVFWTDLLLMGSLYVLVALGVTIGYHRMLTHQGFRCSEALRAIFLILGTMAFEGGPAAWCARHIEHHAYSDEEGDPHSPLHGFWHAHMGWIYHVKSFPDIQKFAPHVLEDRTVMFVDRFTTLWMVLSLLLPFAIGGWTGLLWGGAVRIFLTTHITWSVNSICHTFGTRAFETTDESRNEWIIGLIGLGEGWHNNHHAFPQNAFHGLRWWQFDLSGYVIRSLEAVGLVWDVQRVSRETQEAHRVKAKGMQEVLQELRSQVLLSVSMARSDLSALCAHVVEASLTQEQQTHLLYMQESAAERLHAIQTSVLKASHLKKQKLVAYLGEVQHLMECAKQSCEQELHRFSLQVQGG